MNLYQEINVTEQEEEILIMGNMVKEIQKIAKRLTEFENELDKQKFQTEMLHLRFIQVIITLMNERNMKRKDLAKLLNVSKSYVTQLFAAERMLNMNLLSKLEKIFDITFELSIKYNKTI